MKKITIGIALVLTLVMATSAVWAWDFSDHVKMAPNGKGDLLIFPFYAALPGGWETKITVINTALDRSVVAKLVFRSKENSVELRDFLLYLTPTDVWTGIVRVNTAGGVEIYSADDSCLASLNSFASAANPFITSLPNPSCSPPDMSSIGYIEVIEAAHSTVTGRGYNGVGNTGTLVNLNSPPVSKMALFNAYNNYSGNKYGLTVISGYGLGKGNENPVPAMVTDSINVLTGFMEFRNSVQGHNTTIQATILRDYDATLYGGNALTVVNETYFGDTQNAWNSIGELEAALSKDNLALPFSTGTSGRAITLHFLTFPTKQTQLGTPGSATQCTTGRTFRGPFFKTACVGYAATDYDLSENSKISGQIISPADVANSLCSEVNYVSSFTYPEGWTNYTFGSTTIFSLQKTQNLGGQGAYNGAPVIGTMLSLVAAGTTGDGYTSLPAAYSDGYVRTNATPPINYYYYQYQDETNTGYLPDIAVPDVTAVAGAQETQKRPDRYTTNVPPWITPNEAADTHKPTQPAAVDTPY